MSTHTQKKKKTILCDMEIKRKQYCTGVMDQSNTAETMLPPLETDYSRH